MSFSPASYLASWPRAVNATRVSNLVHPAGHGFALGDSTSVARQSEKGRLEGVFGVEQVVQQALVYAKDQPRVPPEERFKGRLIAVGSEAVEELSVTGATHLHDHVAHPAKNRCSTALGHAARSLGRCSLSI